MATARRKPRPGPAPRHGEVTIQLPASGALCAVVIADTHSTAHPESAQHIEALRPDVILHAGDIGDPEVLAPFERIAPLHAVRGNIDPTGANYLDSLVVNVEAQGQSLLRALLMHIALYGPKLQAGARRLAEQHRCSVVVCGHSHVPFLGNDRGLSVFNPGSIGPRRFNLPITFGVLTLEPGKLSARHVSCETGQTWLP